MKKILPLIFLLVGIGGGVGAGMAFRPDASASDVNPNLEAGISSVESEDKTGNDAKNAPDVHVDEKSEEGESENEYVKLNNQFVVPIVTNKKVAALVVLALSIEVPLGKAEYIYKREPKLRDSFLQVLFDHANIGGFEGNFTNTQVLGRLRTALREVAQRDLGRDIVRDVLIIEIARQDY